MYTFNFGRYVSDNGVLIPYTAIRVADITDGTSNTLVLAETRFHTLNSGDSTYRATCFSGYYIGGGYANGPYFVMGTIASQAPNSSNAACDPGKAGCHNYQTWNQGSYHPGGIMVAMADASVQFLSQNMDVNTYRSLGIRNDGNGSLP